MQYLRTKQKDESQSSQKISQPSEEYLEGQQFVSFVDCINIYNYTFC